jgi:hypothetical protein
MCRGAIKRPDGLLDLDPVNATIGWTILAVIGMASAISMWMYNRWIEKQA